MYGEEEIMVNSLTVYLVLSNERNRRIIVNLE